jgi:large exoprotein involved in heme utilization and adhesion
VLTTTFSSGAAGNINVNATGAVTVDGRDADFDRRMQVLANFAAPFAVIGRNVNPNLPQEKGGLPLSAASGFFASTAAGAAGAGGSITIGATTGATAGPRTITVSNGGEIAANAEGTGRSGNISITGDRLTLSNGRITTQTTSGDGGNIQLTINDAILLRRFSEVSTTAGGNGQGGDITVNTRFLIGLPKENSDIIANAFNGQGGTVTINAQSLFGIAPMSRDELARRLGTNNPALLTPRRLTSNDITAISQNNPTLNGTTQVNTPGIDPNRGLVPLPANSLDPSRQIAQGCQYSVGNNRFVAIGRGGLPSTPMTAGSADDRIIRLAQVPLDLSQTLLPSSTLASLSADAPPIDAPPIVEAQTVERLANGKLRLRGAMPTVWPTVWPTIWPTAGCQAWSG